jgi:hypothetical protein
MRQLENAAMVRTIFGRRAVEDDNNAGASFEQCTFHHLGDLGVYFTRPMLDNNKTIHGPAVWTWPADNTTGPTAVSTFGTHTHDMPTPTNGPSAGDRLLIAFVTVPNGGSEPWVLGWSPT